MSSGIHETITRRLPNCCRYPASLSAASRGALRACLPDSSSRTRSSRAFTRLIRSVAVGPAGGVVTGGRAAAVPDRPLGPSTISYACRTVPTIASDPNRKMLAIHNRPLFEAVEEEELAAVRVSEVRIITNRVGSHADI